jgi:anti-sigma factor RsiW
MSDPACHWVRSVLAAYLDGELKPSTAAAVRKHLEGCRECREHAQGLAETWDVLDEVPAPPVRSGFTQRMMARIVEEKELDALEARLNPNRRLRQVMAAASGLAAGLVLGLALWAWTSLAEQPRSPVEQEVSRSMAFLEDSDLMDEVALIEAMDKVAHRPPGQGGT